MPKYQIASWAKYDIGDIGKASNAELIAAIEKAAPTANKRMRALKKAGFTNGMYRNAIEDLGLGRERFKEHPQKLNRAQLIHEYTALRSFMSSKTSTVRGVRSTNRKRYNTALKRGFTGTEEEFYDLIEKYYTKDVEKKFSSTVIYDIITGENANNKRDLVDEILSQNVSKGEALLQYQEKIEKR